MISLYKICHCSLVFFLWFLSCQVMAQTSDWKWQNPLPTGDVLKDVKFVTPEKGWAVGNNGTILKTTDKGETWLVYETGVQSDIRAVSFSDSLHGWAVGENGLILKTTNGGADWQVLASGSVEVLTSVYFVNSLKGCVVGSNGTILRTTNGGNTWNTSYSGITVPFTSVWFADSTTGWAVAYDGIIRKTTNGGLIWSSQNSQTTHHLFSVRFINKLQGWAVGDQGAMVFTNDGGNSWIPMNSTGPFQPTFGAVYSLGGPDIWVTIMGSGLLKSTNGGSDWQILFYDGFPYEALCFFNDQTGIAVGYGGIGKTTNGGTSWEEVNKAERSFLRSVRFSDPNTGWAVGNDGTLLKTSNRGKNWIRQNIGTTELLKSVFFENPQKGWIIGSYGVLRKTNDGGQSWQTQYTDVSFSPESIYFITSQKGWISGSDGKILTSSNGGTSWQKQQTKTIQTLRSVQFVNDSVGWAVGDSGIILHTTNAGSSWIKQVSGTNLALNQAYFISDQIGWAVGNNGTFLKTSDGGNSWTSQILAQSKYLYSIQFTDSLHGWIAGEDGTLLHSTDGGNSWESTPGRATSNELFGIYFEPSGIGWAVGANGTIISNSGLDDGIAHCLVKGKLFEKSGSDCNTTNLPVSGQVVKATPGPFYGYARRDGNYELRLPLGITPTMYDITTAPTGNSVYQTSLVCPPGGVYNIGPDTLPDTLSNNDFGFDVSHCHLLKVEIASNRRRRCSRNLTTVWYFNHGSAPAPDAYVLVEFPGWVSPVSASKDHTAINDYTWRFDLGNILPGTGGTINMIDSVLCSAPLDLDLVQCTRATIFPVPDCPMPAGWNGSEVTLSGKCHNGNVGLGIYNRTTHDMADSVD